jgi:hypothetical protein
MDRRLVEIDIDARTGSDRPPLMEPISIKRNALATHAGRIQPDCAAHAAGPRRGYLVNLDF